MARVFLSYARDDQQRVSELAGALERAGHVVWWDSRLTGGAEFEREIEQALADAEVVVVAWSATASKSHWVRDEAGAGRDSDRLVPVTLDGTLPPLGFRQFHSIDLSDWQGWDDADCLELETAVAAKAGEARPTGPQAGTPPVKKQKPRGKGLLPIWAWSLIVGVALLAAGAGWWLSQPSRGAPTLALGRVELIGTGVEAGLPATIEQELRAAFGALRVPLTSADADFVLTATVRRVGDSLRLVTGLDDVASATTLWNKSQDLTVGDARALSEHLRSVAAIVECGLSGARGYRGLLRSDQFALYLRYCDADATGTSGQQLDAAREVTAAAPDFIGGWLGLAASANLHAYINPSEQGAALQEEAVAAARRAIEITPEASDGHLWLAVLMAPERATEREALFRRAIALQPFRCACAYQFLGDFLLQTGRVEEALATYQRGLEQQTQTDQVLPLWRVVMASFLAGRLDRANETLQRIETLHPSYPGLAQFRREAALWSSRWGEAAALFRLPRPEEQVAIRGAYLALESRDPSRIAEAGAALERVPVRPQMETIIVPALAQLGRLDAVFAALEESLRRKSHFSAPGRYPGITQPMLWNPLLRPVWFDPRFPAFLQRAGFFAYWRASRSRPDICRAGSPPPFCRVLGP